MDKKPIEILEELCKKNLEGSVHNAIPTKQIVLKAMELYAKQEREKEVKEFMEWLTSESCIYAALYGCKDEKIRFVSNDEDLTIDEMYLKFKETKKQ